jgi:hypothetical protein
MIARSTALAAFLGMAASVRADPAAPGPCELVRADRTRTPSSRCLSCHDGTAAPGLGDGHPVDVDYARASLHDPGRFAPAAALPPEVTLVNGAVSCVSCHDAASPHRGRAVDPARLCLACHRM